MNEDDVDIMIGSSTGCYIESLIKSRTLLSNAPLLRGKLDEVIWLELELAMLSAEKARSSLLKACSDNVVELKK